MCNTLEAIIYAVLSTLRETYGRIIYQRTRAMLEDISEISALHMNIMVTG